jgi:hypothetical protein
MKRRPKRILRGAVLAFAVAAIAAPMAQAKPGPLNLGPNATVQSSAYAPQQFRALQLWSQGMNDRYGISHTTGTVSQAAPPLLVTASDGFNWGDAFVGAAATLATAIVLAFAALSVRRTRHPVRA